jgi:hypothetical protein
MNMGINTGSKGQNAVQIEAGNHCGYEGKSFKGNDFSWC